MVRLWAVSIGKWTVRKSDRRVFCRDPPTMPQNCVFGIGVPQCLCALGSRKVFLAINDGSCYFPGMEKKFDTFEFRVMLMKAFMRREYRVHLYSPEIVFCGALKQLHCRLSRLKYKDGFRLLIKSPKKTRRIKG